MTPEQMRALANRAVQVDDGHTYSVPARDLVEYNAALRAAADQLEAVTAQCDRWAADVIAIERAVDDHAFDDEDGNGWLPLAPIEAVLHPGEAG